MDRLARTGCRHDLEAGTVRSSAMALVSLATQMCCWIVVASEQNFVCESGVISSVIRRERSTIFVETRIRVNVRTPGRLRWKGTLPGPYSFV